MSKNIKNKNEALILSLMSCNNQESSTYDPETYFFDENDTLISQYEGGDEQTQQPQPQK